MQRSQFPPLPILLFLLFLLVPAPQVKAELMTWTNREGKTFRAELTGFKSETKAVVLTSANRRNFHVPVRNLSLWSKLQAVFGVMTLTDAEGQSVGLRVLGGLVGYGIFIYLGLIISSILIGFLCYRLSANVFTRGGDEHLFAYVKIFLALIVFGVVISVILYLISGMGVIATLTSGGQGILPGARSGMGAMVIFLQFVNLLGNLCIPVYVISSHYAIGFARSFAVWLVYGFLNLAVTLMLWLFFAGALLIPIGDTSLGEWVFDKTILAPAGLL